MRDDNVLDSIHLCIAINQRAKDPDAELFSWIAKADERLYQAKGSYKYNLA